MQSRLGEERLDVIEDLGADVAGPFETLSFLGLERLVGMRRVSLRWRAESAARPPSL